MSISRASKHCLQRNTSITDTNYLSAFQYFSRCQTFFIFISEHIYLVSNNIMGKKNIKNSTKIKI